MYCAKISAQEFAATVAGPADGPQTHWMPPYEVRRKIAMAEFQEFDTNKDGQIDRVEWTAHAVHLFIEMDLNKDRFLNEEESKKWQEARAAKMRALAQTLMRPAQGPPRR